MRTSSKIWYGIGASAVIGAGAAVAQVNNGGKGHKLFQGKHLEQE